MSNAELTALVALVNHDAAVIYAQVRQYGELQWDPNTPARQTLECELRERGVIP